MNGQFSEYLLKLSHKKKKQIETTFQYISHLSDQGKRKPKILAAHSVDKTMGKQHSTISVDMHCVTTPMEKSPAKLHRRLLFAQTILLLGLYPKDILGDIEVWHLVRNNQTVFFRGWGLFYIKRNVTTKCNAGYWLNHRFF